MMTQIASRRRRRGQALIEFALMAPAFFLLFIGVLDFGRAGYYYVTTSALSRTTARMAAAFNDSNGFTASDIQTATLAQVKSEAISTISTPAGCAAPVGGPTLLCQLPPAGTAYLWVVRCVVCNPHYVTVNVVYAFTPTTPLISALTGTIYINSRSRMDMEY
jgi:Flp pilus assembly protein TadG